MGTELPFGEMRACGVWGARWRWLHNANELDPTELCAENGYNGEFYVMCTLQ